MVRAVTVALLCLLVAGCRCDANCAAPSEQIEFVGQLVSVDLGSGSGADGSDIAVYRIVTWRSGTTDGPPPSSMAVSYWRTGQLLEVGDEYLVGAGRLESGTYASRIPTKENCDCGAITRRADGSSVDQGLLHRWLTITPWRTALVGAAIGIGAWFLLNIRRHRSKPAHIVGAVVSGAAGFFVASAIDLFDAHTRPANTIPSLMAAATALVLVVLALVVRRMGRLRSDG